MESSDIKPTHGHVSGLLKIILIVSALVLAGGLGYLIWMQNQTPDIVDYSITPTKTSTSTSTTPAAPAATPTPSPAPVEAVAVACGNKAYAFSLTFGAKWSGYKVKEYKPPEAIIYCYFSMPTTSKDDVWTAVTNDHNSGYASVFAVGVYTPAQWATALTEPNASKELGKNDNYVWGYSPAQALPDDLQTSKIADDVKNVIATFKIAP